MTPDEWRQLIGDHVRHRRDELGWSVRGIAARANMSEGLWRQIENGRRVLNKDVIDTVNPKPPTVFNVCKALGWAPDAFDRLRARKKPVVVSNPRAGRNDDVPTRVARLELAVLALLRETGVVLPPDQQIDPPPSTQVGP